MVGAVLQAVFRLHTDAAANGSSAWPSALVDAAGVFAGLPSPTLELVAALLELKRDTLCAHRGPTEWSESQPCGVEAGCGAAWGLGGHIEDVEPGCALGDARRAGRRHQGKIRNGTLVPDEPDELDRRTPHGAICGDDQDP